MKRILFLVLIIIPAAMFGQNNKVWTMDGGVDAYTKTELQTSGSASVNAFNLTNMPYINIEKYGCVGNGATINTTFLQNAINAAQTANIPLLIPEGVFMIDGTGVNVTDTLIVIGMGKRSILQMTTNAKLFTVTAQGCEFRNFAIYGDGLGNGKTVQIGIYYTTSDRFIIENIYFYNSDGSAVMLNGPSGGTQHYGSVIRDCVIEKVRGGLALNGDNQYVNVVNCNGFGGTYGAYINPGNFSFIGCNFTDNTYGYYIVDGGSNDSHGNIIGGKINHNTTNLYVGPIDLGLIVTGVQSHAGIIHLNGSANVTFTGCEFGTIDFRFEGSKATNFIGSILYALTAIQNNYNSTTSYTSWIGSSTIGVNNASLSEITPMISAALTDDTPTDAEIDAATALTPATAGAGYEVKIKDSDGSGLVYIVRSDGTAWQYVKLTIAL